MLRTPNSAWIPVVGTLLAWIVAPCVLWIVVDQNIAAGVYAPDSDSTAIPLAYSVLICFVGSLYLVAVCTLAIWRHRESVDLFVFRWDRWNLVSALILLPIFLITVLEVASWAVPHHYTIAFAYLLPLVGFVYLRAMIASRPSVA
jgi:hypothetical protein